MATSSAIQSPPHAPAPAPAHAPASRKLLVHTVLSIFTFVLGVVLLIYMITVEDEPGALPLALTLGGIAWFFIARWRLRPTAR